VSFLCPFIISDIIMCVFGLAAERIDFDRIEFERIDFVKSELDEN